MLNAEQACTPEGFSELQRVLLESERSIWPARSFGPSTIAHPCDRWMLFRRTHHGEQRPHSTTLQSIFNQGIERERRIRTRMEQLGFEITESDRATQWRVKGALISGKIDGKLKAYKKERYQPMPIWEAKSMSGYQWDQIDSFNDLKKSPHHYTRNYAAQLQMYMYLEATPRGFLSLESKATGLLKILPAELDFGYVEEILQRVERLQGMLDAGVDPPPIPYDHGICGDCGFNHLCFPPRDAGEGFVPIEDTVLLEDLERRAALDPGRKEYDDLDKSVKERLKKLVGPGQTGMLGEFTAEIKEVGKHFKATAERDTTEIHVVIRRVGP